MSTQQRRQTVLKVILALGILSTAAHYSHNFLEVEHYPRSGWISAEMIRAAILISWPALTAIGVAGYWLYARQRYRAAHTCLLVYSLTGLSTLGHFLQGSPDIPPFWYTTIFSDGLTGLAVLTFTLWSIRSRPRHQV